MRVEPLLQLAHRVFSGTPPTQPKCLRQLGRHVCRFVFALSAVALLVGGSACVRSGQVSYYTLSVVSPKAETSTPGMVLGIGPITLPAYLRQPAMVMRLDEHALFYDDFHLWAQALEEAIPTIVGENLAGLLGVTRVAIYPWQTKVRVTYQLVASIQSFEIMPDGQAALRVRWHVLDADGKLVTAGADTYREDTRGDASQAAAALSRALGRWCGVVAKRLNGES